MIRKAGGVPVLAHPFTLGLSNRALRATLAEFCEMGLQGLEVYYSEHSPRVQETFETMAQDLGLARSGGSDFHGDANPRIRMGIGFGRLRVPDELVAELEERRG